MAVQSNGGTISPMTLAGTHKHGAAALLLIFDVMGTPLHRLFVGAEVVRRRFMGPYRICLTRENAA